MQAALRPGVQAAPKDYNGDHVQGDGPRVFDHACRMGLEGIICKLAIRPSPRAQRGTGSWSKVRTADERL